MMNDHHFVFDPATMRDAESHGGIGSIIGRRALSVRPPSFIRHVDQVVVSPGATIGRHRHAGDNEEIYVLIKGGGMMQMEDCEMPVKQGDVVLNPPNGEHGFVNTTDEDAWLAVIEVHFPPAGGRS
jgi:mannose-6-phosphate isomerase-like protein (cupin superfamily)